MSKTVKIWLIAAASLVLMGCMIFGGVMTMLKWDFSRLSTNRYETNSHEISEDFYGISIRVDTSDIRFVPAEDATCSVVCYEQNSMKHTVSVQDGILTIDVSDTRKWYEYIGIGFETSKITVYLPSGEYGILSVRSDTGDVVIPKDFGFGRVDISASTGDITNYASASGEIGIKTSTGKIRLDGVSAGSLDLSVTTGDVTASGITCAGDVSVLVSTGKTRLSGLTCKTLESKGSTGDISLTDVTVTEALSIRRSTGDVTFENSDAAEIFVTTDTGDVKGSLLSEKVFLVKTDTGRISVPDSVTGGRCEITTDTGDIRIEVKQ